MAVLRFEVTSRAPYADGRTFGDVGAYEQIDGTLHFALDPALVCNQSIVDLDLAPCDSQGRVRFEADFSMVQPVVPAARRAVIVELPNRGRRRVVPLLNMAPLAAPDTPAAPAGDGLLFEQGFVVASLGWQWDVYRSDVLLGLEAPHACRDGEPMRGQTMVEMRPNADEQVRLLADRIHRPLPASAGAQADARLLVKDFEDGVDQLIPREDWQFARLTADGMLEASAEHIFYEAGFEAGKIYQLVYESAIAPVAGCGLLALRDVATWLRADTEQNPLHARAGHLYAWGISQTGRMLRHFLSLGLNVGEDGVRAYDGMYIHVAGARRGAFNHRFAQPSNQTTPLWGHCFPFADIPTADALTGQDAGLLDRLERSGGIPRIIYTNTAAEYWRGDAALARISTDGQRDLVEHACAREYLFAGTQHVPGFPGRGRRNKGTGTLARYAINTLDYRPLLRAAMLNLHRWVADDVLPPDSRHPRVADGTAVTRAEVLRRFSELPGMQVPDSERLPVVRTVDMGACEAEGVGCYPATEGDAYPALVAAVDTDGNERAGIALPDVAIPVATYAGWNPRDPSCGASDQIALMDGLGLMFARDAQARQRSGDPRASVAERYADRDAYEAALAQHAALLVEARLLLAADKALAIEAALATYDRLMATQGIGT